MAAPFSWCGTLPRRRRAQQRKGRRERRRSTRELDYAVSLSPCIEIRCCRTAHSTASLHSLFFMLHRVPSLSLFVCSLQADNHKCDIVARHCHIVATHAHSRARDVERSLTEVQLRETRSTSSHYREVADIFQAAAALLSAHVGSPGHVGSVPGSAGGYWGPWAGQGSHLQPNAATCRDQGCEPHRVHRVAYPVRMSAQPCSRRWVLPVP
eukprot:SAG25_NODE_122_length_14632_cov_129.472098_18_plen_210_part_00